MTRHSSELFTMAPEPSPDVFDREISSNVRFTIGGNPYSSRLKGLANLVFKDVDEWESFVKASVEQYLTRNELNNGGTSKRFMCRYSVLSPSTVFQLTFAYWCCSLSLLQALMQPLLYTSSRTSKVKLLRCGELSSTSSCLSVPSMGSLQNTCARCASNPANSNGMNAS